MKNIIILLTLFLFGCNNSIESKEESDKLISQQALILSKKYGYPIIGFGRFNEDGIRGYTFTFESPQIVNQTNARELIVRFADELINNTNKTLKNPIGIKNINLDFYFYDPSTRQRYTKNIGIENVRLIYNEIRFSVREKGSPKHETIHVEPYAEAYEKVTAQKYQPTANEAKSNE